MQQDHNGARPFATVVMACRATKHNPGAHTAAIVDPEKDYQSPTADRVDTLLPLLAQAGACTPCTTIMRVAASRSDARWKLYPRKHCQMGGVEMR
jgi:hypothetical protein